MRIERFEDIEAWKEARKLVNMAYDISGIDNFFRDSYLRNQIRSASVSIMSNISEGFDRGTNREFTQFLIIARASCSEVKSHLYIAMDRKYVNADRFQEIYDQASKTTSLIDGFIRYLRKPRTPNVDPRT